MYIYIYLSLSNGKIIELNDGLSSLMMYHTMVHYQILTQLDRISPPFLLRSILTWSTQKHAVFVSRRNLKKKTPFCCLKPPYDLVQSHFLLVKSTFFDICWVSQAPCSYWKVPRFVCSKRRKRPRNPGPDVVAFNALIDAWVRAEDVQRAEEWLRQMLEAVVAFLAFRGGAAGIDQKIAISCDFHGILMVIFMGTI